jgi:hypothetical protein
MILWFIEAQLFERGPAVAFSPCHRETALLNVQVLFVVPGGIVLGWGVVFYSGVGIFNWYFSQWHKIVRLA